MASEAALVASLGAAATFACRIRQASIHADATSPGLLAPLSFKISSHSVASNLSTQFISKDVRHEVCVLVGAFVCRGQQRGPTGIAARRASKFVFFFGGVPLLQFAGLKGKLHSSSFNKRGAYHMHIVCVAAGLYGDIAGHSDFQLNLRPPGTVFHICFVVCFAGRV